MSSFILQDIHIEEKTHILRTQQDLESIEDAVDAVDLSNSTFNSTTYEHQFDKTCYDSIYFLCLICLVCFIPVSYIFSII